jgi:plasmid replication initiation protein
MGRLADRGGARRGPAPVAADARHALRDPALHRARHVARDYQRLKAALDRLQSTTVATSIRETTGRRLHRFSWINEWKELADASGTPLGIELILPDWFYAGVLDAALVLTIDPAYFR